MPKLPSPKKTRSTGRILEVVVQYARVVNFWERVQYRYTYNMWMSFLELLEVPKD